MRTLVVLLLVFVAGCASRQPAPITDRSPPSRAGTTTPTVPMPRTERTEFYAARAGDTVRSIAAANGMEPRELLELNALADSNRLQVGQVLRLRPATVAALPVTPPKPVADEGVQVNPIALPSPIETRPLEARPLDTRTGETRPAEARPLESGAVEARPPVVAGANVRAEPRAFKLPYSEE
ncbi:MAG: LysM peptidoglycan-binding domain-containing protein, partial [Burkholderiales bacterium]